jgi:hypothetical protein
LIGRGREAVIEAAHDWIASFQDAMINMLNKFKYLLQFRASSPSQELKNII